MARNASTKKIKVTHQQGAKLDGTVRSNTPRDKTTTSKGGSLNEAACARYIAEVPVQSLDGLALAIRKIAKALKIKAGGDGLKAAKKGPLDEKGVGTGSLAHVIAFTQNVTKASSKEEKALFKRLFTTVANRYAAADKPYPKPAEDMSEASREAHLKRA